jgi:uncharacterized protein YbjT (DUF2867 family)
MSPSLSVVMLGASGAVGSQVLARLLKMPQVQSVTLLGRRPIADVTSGVVRQFTVDVLDPDSYRHLLRGHDAAVCTLGVGQPSKMSREEFTRIDKDAVLHFAGACKDAAVEHFQLLSSVGANAASRSFYLSSKGKLQDALLALNFQRVSIFQPSMILTPTNRYGVSQAMILMLWPMLNPLLPGSSRKYRGIRVETLGAAMANNLLTSGPPVEILQWDQFIELVP